MSEAQSGVQPALAGGGGFFGDERSEELQAVNTDGVEPLSSVSNQALPWRKDEVTDGNIQKEVLANAPNQQYGCFAVPKVIE